MSADLELPQTMAQPNRDADLMNDRRHTVLILLLGSAVIALLAVLHVTRGAIKSSERRVVTLRAALRRINSGRPTPSAPDRGDRLPIFACLTFNKLRSIVSTALFCFVQ